MSMSPNTALQRTRLRAPLSFKPFGRLLVPAVLVSVLAGMASVSAEEPVEVLSAVRDLDGNGTADSVSLRLIRGRRYVDNELWCGGGGIEKVEGVFEICVRLAGQQTVCTPLNPLLVDPVVGFRAGAKVADQPPLWFHAEPWSLAFADYNHDGRLDFAVGQYGGCRGWGYTILTVRSSGAVERLLDAHLFVKGIAENSTAFDLTPEGFRYSAWSDTTDDYSCREYGSGTGAGALKLVKETRGACPE